MTTETTVEALQGYASAQALNVPEQFSVKASSKEPLPTTIYFSCQPYADLQPRLFVLRLSVTSDDKAPILKLRIQNMERHTEEMGQELVTLAQDAMRGNAAIPVLLGSYSKGQ